MNYQMHIDDESLNIIRKWNLDNLEYVIDHISNEKYKECFWWLFLPIDYDGIVEALLALTLEDDMEDSIDASMNLIQIEESLNPKAEFKKRITKLREIEKVKGLTNILLIQFLKYCMLKNCRSNKPYKILRISEERKIVCSNMITLKSVFGENWRKYYRKTER